MHGSLVTSSLIRETTENESANEGYRFGKPSFRSSVKFVVFPATSTFHLSSRRRLISRVPLYFTVKSKSNMSSLRNAIPRPAHKERSQPEARKRFGILEKHKDYIIRANAYHKKQETLKILRQKAAFKNPDEFNFKMINSKTVDGRHRPKDEVNKYSAEELMIMKTQDIGYVFQKWQSEKNVSYLSSYTPQELSAYDHIYPVFLFVPSYLL
jgi:hypothetical protein